MKNISFTTESFKRMLFPYRTPAATVSPKQTPASCIAKSCLTAKANESLPVEQVVQIKAAQTKITSNPVESSKDNQKQNRKQAMQRAFWSVMGIWGAFNLIDAGLARTLALETLTHGTGPLGYIGISLNGADPNYGGGNTGSSVGGGMAFHIKNSQKFFHVFKDTEFKGPQDVNFAVKTLYELSLPHALPRGHASWSGAATFGSSDVNRTGNVVSRFIGMTVGALIPTLKFRFTPEEVVGCKKENPCRFENDDDYQQMAYKTRQYISPIHLGMTGTLTQGVNTGMFWRMYNRPGKVVLGVALLGLGAFVAKKTYAYMQSPVKQQAPATQPVDETSISRSQLCKKRFKVIAASGCWTALAISAVFLNTL